MTGIKQKTVLIFLLLVGFIPVGVHAGSQPGMAVYLPKSGELSGWNTVDKPQQVQGEDLFLLINGGAEVYHEYGFDQAITQGYKNARGKSFNLEIYRMSSPEAAYGIYSFKSGETGKPLDIGAGGLLEDYYLNFRKGNFLVTIIGFDSEAETITSLINAARVVAAKINQKSKTPDILQLLPREYKNLLTPNSITYLKGNLVLFNCYEFDPRNIFGVTEGVTADYGHFKYLLFKYPDARSGKQWFSNAAAAVEKNPAFKGFKKAADHFSMKDKNGRSVYAGLQGQYIFAIVLLDSTKEPIETIASKIRGSYFKL
jgi:hypothetical protein